MDSDFGPTVSISVSGPSVAAAGDAAAHAQAAASGKLEKLETENQQLLREVLLCRKNLDIAQSNIASLKALSNQLAHQLNESNGEVDLLRQRRDAAELRAAREHEQAMADLRSTYESKMANLRRELEELIDVNTHLSKESQDSHRKADKSFKDIIATKDELIAELTRTVESLQNGLRLGGGGGQHRQHNTSAASGAETAAAGDASRTSLHSPTRSRRAQPHSGSSAAGTPSPTAYDAVSIRNQVIEPTMDLLRLSLKVLKTDVAMRDTPLGGKVNALFHTSVKKPVTRYFVDVQADKHRLDEVATVDLMRVAGGGSGRHFTQPDWPRVWKFQTPQGELITLTMDISSL